MKIAAAAMACSLALAGSVHAATVIVGALANSSSGGVGATTGVFLDLGDIFTVSVELDDLWNAGALPRWSNADGLVADTYATTGDESGQATGVHIGMNFGLWSQAGLNAPYGSLVGRIGSVYRVLGTSFSGPAWDTGALSLYYWDSNNGDNTGSIAAMITAVPEPEVWTLMITGLGLAGAALRRRRTAAAA